ncbi:Sensory box/GGDEF family protein [Nitrincola lacisaponensis]|uniref:Sensory box/GGDEF family protein n=1 Tax=Nitrincola lacisaponensis TaxID=267850 RepID=A0A063Y4W8_9GAMM|nr:diguanylate cyclase [Nitrincola lacisaponensis]KDE39811.1 Sensory box/GGDEF family protein [Nitrincola lacisaponensis]
MSFKHLLTCVLCTLVFGSTISHAEPDWTQQPVQMCVDPDWEPLEKLTPEGEFIGIAADLLRLIFERAALKVEIVQTADWNETLKKSQAGECDIIGLLNKTEARSQWLDFTRPYLIDPNVVVTRNEHPYISDLRQLSGKRVALPAGTSVYERVKRDYPAITLIPVDSEYEAFDLVDRGIADASIRALTVAAYTIRKEGWFNLKVAGEIPDYKNLLRIGVLKEHNSLLEQLDQAVGTLTETDINTAINQHIQIAMHYRQDWTMTLRVLVGAAALVSLLLAIGLLQFRAHRRLLQLKQTLENTLEDKNQIETRLRESEYFYRSLLDTAHEGIAVIQQDRLVYGNPRLAELTGYSLASLTNLPTFLELVAPADRGLIEQNYRKRLQGETAPQRYEVQLLRQDQSLLDVQVSGVVVDWYGQPATLNFVTDISKRKEAEREILHLANHDPLTGLANRRLLMDRLEQLLNQAQRYQHTLAVIFLDLDGFKPVNDRWGHEMGDQLLQAVAERLQSHLRNSDTLARIGGDEFVVLMPHAEQKAVSHVAEKLIQAIEQPFQLGDIEIRISTSLGVARYPQDGDSASALLQKADRAMYAHKSL